MTRHFLADDDLSPAEQAEVLELAATLKRAPFDAKPLAGPRSVATIYDKPTLRTQVSFAAGIAELGGQPDAGRRALAGIGVRESVPTWPGSSAARQRRSCGAPSRRRGIEEMAAYAGVPVVNALTDEFHPCQLLADLLTVREHKGDLAGLTVDVPRRRGLQHGQLLAAGRRDGRHARAGQRSGRLPPAAHDGRAGGRHRRDHRRLGRPRSPTRRAVAGADVVVTDTWVSMGKEEESAARLAALAAYSLTPALLSGAAPDAIVLHCLPAYRGKEIAAEVIDGPQSVVWDEAENRRHAQKAILTWLLEQS